MLILRNKKERGHFSISFIQDISVYSFLQLFTKVMVKSALYLNGEIFKYIYFPISFEFKRNKWSALLEIASVRHWHKCIWDIWLYSNFQGLLQEQRSIYILYGMFIIPIFAIVQTFK